MRVIADTHVHFYPCYDAVLALHSLRTHLSLLDRDAVCMAFLAERSDCNFFAGFEENVAPLLSANAEIRRLDGAVHLCEPDYPELYIFPGRQIVTRERIEVLSLTVDPQIVDGLPAEEVVGRIRQAKGIPVVSWAPGKWFFSRKKVVEHLLDINSPGSLLIGDTSLRPTCWPRPRLMAEAARRGFTVISGSDPLPFTGEEQVLGCYGTTLECDFDPDNPVESIWSIFTRPGCPASLVGSRGGGVATLQRLIKNSQSK